MGSPAAKQGDAINAVDTHDIINSSGTKVPTPHPFSGTIDGGLCDSVLIMGMPAATVDSTATNSPPHTPQGGSFESPPDNAATIVSGSSTVNIGGKPAARDGDSADTCDDLGTPQGGTVSAGGSVLIG